MGPVSPFGGRTGLFCDAEDNSFMKVGEEGEASDLFGGSAHGRSVGLPAWVSRMAGGCHQESDLIRRVDTG